MRGQHARHQPVDGVGVEVSYSLADLGRSASAALQAAPLKLTEAREAADPFA